MLPLCPPTGELAPRHLAGACARTAYGDGGVRVRDEALPDPRALPEVRGVLFFWVSVQVHTE